jgi:2-amino-4-hydroxy-6-hydroxymethyldihydropteridine diphosphokinase
LLGRTRTAKYSPRTIDIDIIFAGDLIIDQPDLVIPHVQAVFRRFVLLPASNIAAEWIHPLLGKTLHQLLEECEDPSWVRPVKGLLSAKIKAMAQG